MLGGIKTITEYHDNGVLFYEMDIAFIEPMFMDLYNKNNQVREMLNGSHCQPYIILRKQKYFDNGQLAWCLKYDEQGNLINKNDNQYRKDGTIIIY